MSHAIVLASVASEGSSTLPLSPLTCAAIAAIIFLSLLGLTWSFRNTTHRRR